MNVQLPWKAWEDTQPKKKGNQKLKLLSYIYISYIMYHIYIYIIYIYIPFRNLTYPTMGKGKSSTQKGQTVGYMLVPWRAIMIENLWKAHWPKFQYLSLPLWQPNNLPNQQKQPFRGETFPPTTSKQQQQQQQRTNRSPPFFMGKRSVGLALHKPFTSVFCWMIVIQICNHNCRSLLKPGIKGFGILPLEPTP